MNLTNPKIKFVLLVIVTIGLFGLLLLAAFYNSSSSQKDIDPEAPYQNYTDINLLIPGKTTEADAIKLLGSPKSEEIIDDKKYLYYLTPFEGFQNFVGIEAGAVSHALENVFGNYRGSVSDYVSKYGKEDVQFYPANDEGTWYVWLNEGVAVWEYGEIRQVFYFIPQNEDSFYNNFKEVLSITSVAPPEEGVEFMPPEGE